MENAYWLGFVSGLAVGLFALVVVLTLVASGIDRLKARIRQLEGAWPTRDYPLPEPTEDAYGAYGAKV